MNTRSAAMWWGLAAVVVAGAAVRAARGRAMTTTPPPGSRATSRAAPVRSRATTSWPTSRARTSAYDVEPYVAIGEDGEAVTLGYYGAPGVPGFGLAAIYTDQQFSMVIADPDSDEAVACGDILRPDADQFGEAGLAVVQLLPVGVERRRRARAPSSGPRLQRELDITPTQVRIILSTEPVSVPDDVAAGYEGYVRADTATSPSRRDPGRARERGRLRRHAVQGPLRRHGRPRHRRLLRRRPAHLASVWPPPTPTRTSRWSSRMPRRASRPRAATSSKPDADEFVEAGLALVQISPTGDDGVQGYAVVERVAMQRELDVTPTFVRVLLFAPPAD